MYLKRMTTSLKCNPLFSKTFGYINKKYRQHKAEDELLQQYLETSIHRLADMVGVPMGLEVLKK